MSTETSKPQRWDNDDPSSTSELLVGAGEDRTKRYWNESLGIKSAWTNLTTLDINEDVKPDVVWDLNELPYPFDDACFDEIHAYEVLEHCGSQGDWRFFFAQVGEFHRMLREGGVLIVSCPLHDSVWAWGDPGHVRCLPHQVWTYVDRSFYGVEGNPRTNYLPYFNYDFALQTLLVGDDTYMAVLIKR